MLGPKTASNSELSRGAINPVIYLICICEVQCDSSLPAISQIELTLHHAKLKSLSTTAAVVFCNCQEVLAVKFEEENIYISMTTLEEHSLQKVEFCTNI